MKLAGHDDSASGSDRVDAILADFVAALDAGKPRDRADLYRAYPEFKAEFDQFFRDDDLAGRNLHAPTNRGPSQITPTSGAGENDQPPSPQPTLPLGKLMTEASEREMPRQVGDYEILEEIASGGMGIVYKARQVSLNRVVALKMILRGPTATADDLQRFRGEAEAAAALNHPNIVTIHEVGRQEGSAYFSMKLIEGGSLAQYLSDPRRSVNAPEERRSAARIIAQVARAVHHAHLHGILHRDLKPGNILLQTHGSGVTPYVTDFGLAKRLEADADLTRTGVILGTPGYMAPEQAAGKPVTAAADIFSLGTVIYQMLCGRRAFHAENPMATLWQVQFQDPRSPRSCVTAIDCDLETICMKCLRKQPADRYATAEELAEDLERWLANEPIRARPQSSLEQLQSWVKRQPARLSVVVCLSVILAVILGSLLWVQHRQRQDAAEIARREAQRYRECLDSAAKAFPNRLEVERWLAECLPMLRENEWSDLKGRARELPLVISNLGERILALEYSPDSTKIAAIIAPATLCVWCADSGALLHTVKGEERLTCLAFRPDNKCLAWAGRGKDHIVTLLDLETKAQCVVSTDAQPAIVWTLAFSPDGQLLASGSGGAADKLRGARIWKVDTGQKLVDLPNPASPVRALAFHPNGELLAMSSLVVSSLTDPTLSLWQWREGHRLWSIPEPVLRIAFDGPGKRIATLSGDRNEIRVWGARSAELITKLSCGETLDGFQFVDKAIMIATLGGKLVTCDPQSGKILHRKSFKMAPTLNAVVAPTGEQAAFATSDKSLVLWNVPNRH